VQSTCVIFSPTSQFGECNTHVEIGATWGWNMSPTCGECCTMGRDTLDQGNRKYLTGDVVVMGTRVYWIMVQYNLYVRVVGT